MEEASSRDRNSLSVDLAHIGLNLGHKPKIQPRPINELLELSSDDESEDRERDSDKSDEESYNVNELECGRVKEEDPTENTLQAPRVSTCQLATSLAVMTIDKETQKHESNSLEQLPKNVPAELAPPPSSSHYVGETPIKTIQIVGSSRPNPCFSHKSLFTTPQNKMEVDSQKHYAPTPATIFAHWSQNGLQTPLQNPIPRLMEGLSTEKSSSSQSSTSKAEPSKFYHLENKKVRRPLAETMMPVVAKKDPKQSFSFESRHSIIASNAAPKIEALSRPAPIESNLELKENSNPNVNDDINGDVPLKPFSIPNKNSIIARVSSSNYPDQRRPEGIIEIPKETPQLFSTSAKNDPLFPATIKSDPSQLLSTSAKNDPLFPATIKSDPSQLFPTTVKNDPQLLPTIVKTEAPSQFSITVRSEPQKFPVTVKNDPSQVKIEAPSLSIPPAVKNEQQLFPTAKSEPPELFPARAKNETPKIIQQVPMSFDRSNNDQNKYFVVKQTKYRILRKIGKGMSGDVYMVQNLSNNEIQAIKYMDFMKLEKEGREGCLDEIKMLHKLQAPCVIKMFDYEVQRTHASVVMELGDTDLSCLIKSNAHETDIYFTLYYWRQMLIAVNHIHKNGVIHSDLKPGNFVLVKGVLKIIDFGIASSINADMTSVVKSTTTGTLNYISPEALTDIEESSGNGKHKINCKSDVWALGCILYSLVYGHTPFHYAGNQWQKIAAIQNPKHKINFPQTSGQQMKFVPPILIDVMKKCLNRDRQLRPTVEELLKISYISTGNPAPAPEIPAPLLFKILNKKHTEEEGKQLLKLLEERRHQ